MGGFVIVKKINGKWFIANNFEKLWSQGFLTIVKTFPIDWRRALLSLYCDVIVFEKHSLWYCDRFFPFKLRMSVADWTVWLLPNLYFKSGNVHSTR